MPLPAEPEAGLDLTNIRASLDSTLEQSSGLALADILKRLGSDAVTEAKLTGVLGRHVINKDFKPQFQSSISPSNQTKLSRYFDITLHSGASEPIQGVLSNDDAAVFSMAVQLSLLSFACEHESLAHGITTAVESILAEEGDSLEAAPDQILLLGTISTYRQQTADFHWNTVFEAAWAKIKQALKQNHGASNLVGNCPLEQFKERFEELSYADYILCRAPSYPVLKALIRAVPSLQGSPENTHLNLECSTGLLTVIVWCHYVLGIDMIVYISGGQIRVGDREPGITLRVAKVNEDNAVLYKPKDQQDPPILSYVSCWRSSD